jgi:transcriptional regulator with XRE-family HTH domain
MKTHFDIEQFIEAGVITNELDFERALIADRKLRLLSKDNEHFKNLRHKLRDLMAAYEYGTWNEVSIVAEAQMTDSYRSETIAEEERVFMDNRKAKIRNRLSELDLTQEHLGVLLGHKSKTHMSELMNGIKSFTLNDLIIINKLLGIDIKELIPVFLSPEEQDKVKIAVNELDQPGLTLDENSLSLNKT